MWFKFSMEKAIKKGIYEWHRLINCKTIYWVPMKISVHDRWGDPEKENRIQRWYFGRGKRRSDLEMGFHCFGINLIKVKRQ